MSGSIDLLVVGELNPDAIVLGAELQPAFGQAEVLAEAGALTVGSSGAITACGAARLGLATAYVGVAGDDPAGRLILAELRDRGVDIDRCRLLEGESTGLTVILSRGSDRAIVTAPGAMASLTAADVGDEALAAAHRLHVSSPHLQPGLREGLAGLLERARAHGAAVSLDPNWDPSGEWDGLADVLPAVDVLLLNEEEASRLSGREDAAGALEALAERVPAVVVKRGAAGAIARRGSETCAVDAPALEAVDATGAGDSLAAGFLAGLGAGDDLEQALRLGVACGSLSTLALGGVAAQPDLERARELAAGLRVHQPAGGRA